MISPNPLNNLFWIRVGLAILSGLVAGTQFTASNPRAFMGIFIAISTYMFSLLLARNLFQDKIAKNEWYKLFTAGLGSFIMLFLFTWILYNTLLGSNVTGFG